MTRNKNTIEFWERQLNNSYRRHRNSVEGWLAYFASQGKTLDQADALEQELMAWKQVEESAHIQRYHLLLLQTRERQQNASA